MKKLCALLLFACLPLTAEISLKIQPVKIYSGVLGLVDGTPFIDIGNMMWFTREIYRLETKGTTALENSTGLKQVFTIESNGVCYSLEQLVELEQNNDPRVPQLLEQAYIAFESISDPYLEQAKAAKPLMIQLIKDWSNLRSKPHSHLLGWSHTDGNEKELFKKNVNTAAKLLDFCEDLRIFMFDLMHTCEKSLNDFKETYKKQREQAQCKK
jgi:hypothetical protein